MHAQGIWVDDMFMGTALATEWGTLSGDQSHVLWAAEQVIAINNYLVVDEDGLYHHGFNNYTGHISCCKWARGNKKQ